MNDNDIDILLIEDNPADVKLIENLLKKSNDNSFKIESYPRLNDGMNVLNEKEFDIILLDLSLPDSDRKNTLKTIIRNDIDIPVIILTGLDEKKYALQSLQRGAQDYLTKGELNSNILNRSILYAIERYKIEHEKVSRAIKSSPLDEKDKEILNLLQENCRISYNELSNRIGLAASTIHNRVRKMSDEGIIKFCSQVDPYKIGFKTIAILGLRVDPLQLNNVAEKIASYDQVQLVATATGDHDIVVQLFAVNEKELWRFINNNIKTIEGVSPQLDVSSFIDTIKMTRKITF